MPPHKPVARLRATLRTGLVSFQTYGSSTSKASVGKIICRHPLLVEFYYTDKQQMESITFLSQELHILYPCLTPFRVKVPYPKAFQASFIIVSPRIFLCFSTRWKSAPFRVGICPIRIHYIPAFAFSNIPYLHTQRITLRLTCPEGEYTGLLRSALTSF